jgi:NAD-dependent DNA ligase
MGSLDKVKTEQELTKWTDKQSNAKSATDFIVTQKLDGISALFYRNGNNSFLFTRGNGEYGQNISHLLPFLNFPKTIPNQNEFVVRGELIIPNNDELFQNVQNLRNVVCGLVNSKEQDAGKFEHVRFVAYRYYSNGMTMLQQLQFLEQNKFDVPMYVRISLIQLDIEKLVSIQENMVQNGEYQIDGLVVTNNISMSDNDEIGKNPSHSVAFKIAGVSVQTSIKDIEWNVSKYGVIKPRIQLEPVLIGGARIEWVTGNNAKYIVDNKLGPDSIVELIRSGDVIPKIQRVVKATTAKLPSNLKWTWNKTNVDIILCEQDETNSEMESQKLLFFFQELETPNLGPKTVEKLYECGFKTVPDILSLTLYHLLNECHYKQLSANNILKGINFCKEKLTNIPEYLFMYVSGCFGIGFGSKKLQSIMEQYPNFEQLLQTQTQSELVQTLKKVRGIASMAETFITHFPNYIEFKKTMQPFVSFQSATKAPTQTEVNGIVVFSGFRNKQYLEKLEAKGWQVQDNVTKKTNYVVFKDDDTSSKCTKAKSFNIPVLSIDQFSADVGL